MNYELIKTYISNYGMIAIFIIVLLEYMNMPGFPAGVIMPAAGIFAAHGEFKFLHVMIVALIAGIIGSWLLYAVGYYNGNWLLSWARKKQMKVVDKIDNLLEKLNKNEYLILFLSKLIPTVRTLISIPAGIVKMDPIKYTLYSALGITIWNAAFIGAGYILGEAVFKYFPFK